MAYDGTLKFDTRVDSSGFKSGVEKLGSIAKTGLKVAATAIGSVSGAFGAAVLAGVKYNSQMEQYITSFGTMLGSAEKATKLVNDLKVMGAETPFETSDLAKGSQTLLAFGTAAEDLLPTLQMLGDVSQGNKERFDSLTLAFAQVSSAGKLTGQDLLQFVNAGFNPLNEISKITGESMSELRDRMSEGGVSAEEVAQAFQHATSEGGQFYQAMEEQSKTFNGQLSTLKDNAMSFIGELTQGVSNTLKDTALPMVNGWLEELQNAFTSSGVEGVVTSFGGILAEACVKLAEEAPGVVDLAVGFIQSFIKGVRDNAAQILQAAQKIVETLANGLVQLLPKEIQKPVQEMVDILKRSFENGGLKNAINTVSKILKELGKVITNIAKAVLPPLAKAIDFLGDNLKIILPLVTAVVAGFKAFNIIKSVTTMLNNMKTAFQTAALQVALFTAQEGAAAVATSASATALTAKEVIVGVLTGKIGLATAAQWLWNAAMSANPIGLITAAIAALVAGIGILILSQNQEKSSAEQLAEVNEDLGESFGNVGQAASDFYDGIQNAESYLSKFNDTLFSSSEEQQELQNNMQEVQSGITEICRRATEERRNYTAEEIQQLDEYFDRLDELQEQEFAREEARTEAIKQQAVTIAETHQGSLAEYEETAQQWIKTAQDQADQEIAIAEEQAITAIALLNQRYGEEADMSNQAYADEYNAIMERKDEKIKSAQEEVGEIAAVYQQGYLDRADSLRNWLTTSAELSQQEAEEKERHNTALSELEQQRNAELEEIYSSRNMSQSQMQGAAQKVWEDYNRAIEEENERNTKELLRIHNGYQEGFSEDVQKDLGSWIAMLGQADLYGGKISTENQEMVRAILSAYDNLPEDAKEKMDNTMSGMLKSMEEKTPALFAKSESIVGGILNILTNGFQIASPSKVTKRIFGYVMQGAEAGMEEEEPNLLKQTAGIANSVIEKFRGTRLDVSAMVQKMKAAVAAESSRMSASFAAPGSHMVLRESQYSVQTESNPASGRYVAELHVDLEGREVARATAPFMGEQLAWEG